MALLQRRSRWSGIRLAKLKLPSHSMRIIAIIKAVALLVVDGHERVSFICSTNIDFKCRKCDPRVIMVEESGEDVIYGVTGVCEFPQDLRVRRPE